MLMQVARQEAAAAPARRRNAPQAGPASGLRRAGSAGDLRRNPLRRSASVDGSDAFGARSNGGIGGGGMLVMNGGAMDAQPFTGLDGRPRSAEASFSNTNGSQAGAEGGLGPYGGAVGWGSAMNGAGAMRPNAMRQRQAQARAAAAAAQMQHQFARRAAACTLQAHWRGWQHRRLARYLRARRKRALRLDWLWHLEYVTNLMHWHEAAHTVQAHWRGWKGRDGLEVAKTGITPPAAKAAGASGEAAGAAEAPLNDTSEVGSDVAAKVTAARDAENAASAAKGVGGDGDAKAAVALSGKAAVPGRLTVHWPDLRAGSELAEVRMYKIEHPVG